MDMLWVILTVAVVLAVAVFSLWDNIMAILGRKRPHEQHHVDRLTPVHIDISGDNPWTGDEKINNFLRLCRRTQVSGIVLGFVERGLTRPGLMTTGDYATPDDIPDELVAQIEHAAWAREFNLNRKSDQRLFNSWLYRMVKRLKTEADARHTGPAAPMELPDWFKSVLEFTVQIQGTKAAYGHVQQHMHNAAGGEATDGIARGTATFGSLDIQIRAYIDGVGKRATRRESSYALQQQP